MRKIMSMIILVAATGISFGQVANIPTFVNEDKVVVLQYKASRPFYEFGTDTIRTGKMYLKIEGKQMNIYINTGIRSNELIPLDETTTNYFLQKNILTLEGNENNDFVLVLHLSEKDRLTFMEFQKRIPK